MFETGSSRDSCSEGPEERKEEGQEEGNGTGEADEDTSGEQRLRAVYFVCGAVRGHEPLLCAKRELDSWEDTTEENV
ncbi:uncharacterized protein MONOS_18439 [Monocercomonoides exilis]|uniref:uncharacterized protein n=1 Tax=Monocercomonoides exilis TaxID=2049356 RepID=UPI00355A080C|nr:hypothetical protein MONOS_18439 [Monocercomonoides exilis]